MPPPEACLAPDHTFWCLDLYFPPTTFQLSTSIYQENFQNFLQETYTGPCACGVVEIDDMSRAEREARKRAREEQPDLE